MANILSRPMFKLGGKPNADGVGITSGLNRRQYDGGTNPYLSEMEEMLPGMLEKGRTAGMISTPELALMASNVLGQGGNISEMVQNMSNVVLPRALDYQKMQASMPFKKFEALGTMADLKTKSQAANKRLLPREKEAMLEELIVWKTDKQNPDGTWMDPDDHLIFQAKMKIISGTGYLTDQEASAEALKILSRDPEYMENPSSQRSKDKEKRLFDILTGKTRLGSAQGGRVGRAYGNPDPMMTETVAEDIQTPGVNEEMVATETMQVPQQPNPAQDPYIMLRARLPKEITDDVVRLIAYNQEAFKDFAAIETQQDVIDFNQTYGVELVVPALTV